MGTGDLPLRTGFGERMEIIVCQAGKQAGKAALPSDVETGTWRKKILARRVRSPRLSR